MSLDHLRRFLKEMQNDDILKDEVLSSSTADDVALIALRNGYEFSGDELLRFSGKKLEELQYKRMMYQENIIKKSIFFFLAH